MNEVMPQETFDLASSLDTEEAYNPLEFIEGEDDEDWAEDDSLILPKAVPPEFMESKKHVAVFSPERTGSVAQAVRDLVETNKASRGLLLSVIDWAREGIPARVLFTKIAETQTDTHSIYEPVSYCRMLERAGALKLEFPELDGGDTAPTNETEDAAPGIRYLSIEEEVDPLWRSTEEGLAIYEELIEGSEWREKILGEDRIYAEVYLAVMNMLVDGGKPKDEIVDRAETFEVTKEPRKFGMYFVDVLEATSAIQWSNGTWCLTDLGRKLLLELAQTCESKTTCGSSPEQEA